MYLKNLHQEGLNGLAFVDDSLTSNLQPSNVFRINIILLKEWSDSCQTDTQRKAKNRLNTRKKIPSNVSEKYIFRYHVIARKTMQRSEDWIPHWDDIFNFSTIWHAILSESNSILPFACTIMSLQSFLHAKHSKSLVRLNKNGLRAMNRRNKKITFPQRLDTAWIRVCNELFISLTHLMYPMQVVWGKRLGSNLKNIVRTQTQTYT